jgi:hypothetical protein
MTVYGNAPILRSRWELKIGHGYPAIPNIFFGKVRKYTTNLPDAHESPRTTFCDKLSKVQKPARRFIIDYRPLRA